jgi:hypothetical protein
MSIVIFVVNNLAFVRWLSHHDETRGETYGAVKRHLVDFASVTQPQPQEAPPKAKATVGDNLVSLDINKICPRSSAINTINSSSPPSQLMSTAKLRSVVKHWHEINCPEKNTCQFSSIGQHLLHLAMKWNQTLLTVQVGAMDGRSNDPMYGMFVKTWGKNYVQAREIVPGEDSLFPNLSNWLPVMIEPVPKNYDDMEQTYLRVAKDKGLGCAVPINAAVSYDSEKSSCAFCRVNTAEDSPQRCKGKLSFHKKIQSIKKEELVSRSPPTSNYVPLLRSKNSQIGRGFRSVLSIVNISKRFSKQILTYVFYKTLFHATLW